jgi:hypothetical protein
MAKENFVSYWIKNQAVMKNKRIRLEKLSADPKGKEMLDYLEGRMSAQEKRKLEELITDDEFTGDALEGLSSLENTGLASQIHNRLQKRINKHLYRKNKKLLPLNFPIWIVLLISVLLLIALAGYVLIALLGE